MNPTPTSGGKQFLSFTVALLRQIPNSSFIRKLQKKLSQFRTFRLKKKEPTILPKKDSKQEKQLTVKCVFEIVQPFMY